MRGFGRAFRNSLLLVTMVLLATRSIEAWNYVETKSKLAGEAVLLDRRVKNWNQRNVAKLAALPAGKKVAHDLNLGVPLVGILAQIKALALGGRMESPSLAVLPPAAVAGEEGNRGTPGLTEHRIDVSLVGSPRDLLRFAEAVSTAPLPLCVDSVNIGTAPNSSDEAASMQMTLRVLVEGSR
jgi:hypothetical protein